MRRRSGRSAGWRCRCSSGRSCPCSSAGPGRGRGGAAAEAGSARPPRSVPPGGRAGREDRGQDDRAPAGRRSPVWLGAPGRVGRVGGWCARKARRPARRPWPAPGRRRTSSARRTGSCRGRGPDRIVAAAVRTGRRCDPVGLGRSSLRASWSGAELVGCHAPFYEVSSEKRLNGSCGLAGTAGRSGLGAGHAHDVEAAVDVDRLAGHRLTRGPRRGTGRSDRHPRSRCSSGAARGRRMRRTSS